MRKGNLLESQENIAESQWDKRYKEKYPYRKDKPKPVVLDFFKKYLAELKGGKVLDLGCGNGRNLKYIARLGFKVYGLDISEAALMQLKAVLEKESLKAIIQKGSFYKIPYKDKFFNSVISINVLQHNNWNGAEKAFAEISRVLKDNGLFLLSVRSASRELPKERRNISDRGVTFIPKKGTKAGIMIHHYSQAEIKELASKNSLEILSMKEATQSYKRKWIVTFRKR